MLEGHVWPGNVRELENVIERAVITATSPTILAKDIAVERRSISITDTQAIVAEQIATAAMPAAPWTPGQTLNDIERTVILGALEHHKGNRTHTARALGISIRTLRNKLSDYRKLGINV
jgi:DNA-binding NtrC family response regulator